MKEIRKLNTILFADITGYTSIMQVDEEKAMNYLQRFKSLLEDLVPRQKGRIIQYFGDGCLLSFDSVTSGVQCAILLQKEFLKEELPVRIGMHLGEVVFTEYNAFGDGVNIASRIESMGIPGSVLVSDVIRNQIKNKAEFTLKSLGSFEFKNVTEPMEVYALENEGLSVPVKSKITGKFKEPNKGENKVSLKKFFSELERRKVYQVSIAYGIAAWLLAQIANLLSDSFEADPMVMKMVIIILILGFPVALILSWIFDIGPKGIERTAAIDDSISGESQPISVKMIIGILVFIILLVLGSQWSFQELRQTKDGPINSLAILPFDNFTGMDSLEYFADGMQSSLIGDMQKISALRVLSKTSSSSFKGNTASIPAIATELNVDAAIEGSITCMGDDSICVQIRLIRVFPEEKQMWVQDYRIEKKEILNFYSNVTKQISKEIDVALTPTEDRLLARSRQVNPEAYAAYLKGLYYWEKLDERSAQEALKSFQLAIELDPQWADPYAGLANAWGLFGYFGFLPKSMTLPKTYSYLNKALELDPNSAQAHYVAATLATWTEWDWEKGEREFLKSLELDPNDAMCRMYYAHSLMIQRRIKEANQQAKIGLELDPMRPLILGLYGVVQEYNNNNSEAAIEAFEKSLSIDPNFGFSRGNLMTVVMEEAYEKGDYDEWVRLWNEKVSKGGRWKTEGREAVLKAFNENGFMAALEEMLKMNDIYGNECFMSAEIRADRFMKLNKYDKALEQLEKDLGPYISTEYPYYKVLKDNPRYIEILRKMNLPS